MAASLARARKVAIVGFPGAQALDLIGPLEVFSMSNRLAGAAAYEVVLASPDGGEIVCNSGLRLAGMVRLADLGDLDTVLVVGGEEEAVFAASASDLPGWFFDRSQTTRRVGSVCSGAFILAAAGLLDGRRATTHWGFCDAMRKFRPAVLLEPDAIFVADPPFYTSAGVTAGIDLCLAFVEADCGFDLALAVARNLVLFMRRPGGQSQFSAALGVTGLAQPRLRKLIAEVSADPSASLNVTAMAARAAMSTRNFSRSFKRETGLSPAAFLEGARLDKAKAALETSDWSLARVAEHAGFGSLHGLHRGFQKRIGVTPGEYRQRFGRRWAAEPASPGA